MGVYVPSGNKDIGVYAPKKKSFQQMQDAKFKRDADQEGDFFQGDFASGESAGQHLLTPPNDRRRRGKKPRRKRKRRHRFNIPFDPKKPLNLVSSLGSQIQDLRKSFHKDPSPQRRRRRRQRGPQGAAWRRNRRRKQRTRAEEEEAKLRRPPPYKFQSPDFMLPPLPEYSEASVEPPTKSTPVHENPYVPKFMKEMLARVFLKNPDAYIAYLREREERRKKGLLVDEGDGPLGYIHWVDNEPYYKTPPPPLLTSGEMRDLEEGLLAAVVAPSKRKAQRPFRPRKQQRRHKRRKHNGEVRRKKKHSGNSVEATLPLLKQEDITCVKITDRLMKQRR